MRSTARDEPGFRRRLSGRINADGTIAQGTGFTCRKTATGAYEIKATDPGWRGIAIFTATAFAGTYYWVANENASLSPGMAQPRVFRSDTNVLLDVGFTFTMEEPI
jgi:hypothetical protein